MSERARIASVLDVPENGSLLYRVEDNDGTVKEAILVRHSRDVVSWFNYCRHFTHIRLDKGSGVTTRDGEIVCTNHGAMFEQATGECTYGPCEGASLEPVSVTVEKGVVYLDDPEYDFVDTGPIPRDPGDLTSTSHIEF